jgi:hypothetical protein
MSSHLSTFEKRERQHIRTLPDPLGAGPFVSILAWLPVAHHVSSGGGTKMLVGTPINRAVKPWDGRSTLSVVGLRSQQVGALPLGGLDARG